MTKTPQLRSVDLSSVFSGQKGDSLPFRALFDAVSQPLSISEGVIMTTLPRGTVQIAQPQRLHEAMLKSYAREAHAHDRPTWRAILTQKPVRATDCWKATEFENSGYFRLWLQPAGFRYAASAPLKAPVLDGYPGAVALLRTAEQGEFNDAELAALADLAQQIDQATEKIRASRKSGRPDKPAPKHRGLVRQFIFDSRLRPVTPQSDLGTLDDRLRQQVLDLAKQSLQHVNGEQVYANRVPMPDTRGDLWFFRVVTLKDYPALGDGPFVVFSLQPDCWDWQALRASDFQADSELSRLIPAIRYMKENYSRGPTLTEISKIVHLSPFHFHRRFTELLGITPKHFMLDCQIEQAKSQLLAGDKDLAEIASACGFAHQSHFTSRFKQATGMTPTRWRRANRASG
jgi:AraC-like DNA-binding protein